MPISFSNTHRLGIRADLAVDKNRNLLRSSSHFNVRTEQVGRGIFCPSDEPTQPTAISKQQLRRNPGRLALFAGLGWVNISLQPSRPLPRPTLYVRGGVGWRWGGLAVGWQ